MAGADRSVFTVAFSPDGQTLAAASGDKTLRLWDVTTPQQPALLGPPLTAPAGSGSLAGTVAFGPRGRLAAGSADGTVQLWDLVDIRRPVPLR